MSQWLSARFAPSDRIGDFAGKGNDIGTEVL
jgi:hypothetical protein